MEPLGGERPRERVDRRALRLSVPLRDTVDGELCRALLSSLEARRRRWLHLGRVHAQLVDDELDLAPARLRADALPNSRLLAQPARQAEPALLIDDQHRPRRPFCSEASVANVNRPCGRRSHYSSEPGHRSAPLLYRG